MNLTKEITKVEKFTKILVDFEILPNNVLTNKGDLVHFSLLVEVEPIDYVEAMNQDL